ncbi:hypothetical protein ABFS83_04G038600 [Erythranthe nasuta]
MFRKVVLVTTALLLFLLLITIKPNEATRILDEDEEQWMKKNINKEQNLLLLPSLQGGRPTGPPAPNGCSWVPGEGRPCTTSINQRNFAMIGSRDQSPPPPPPATVDGGAYPEQMIQFGVAAGTK